VYSSLNAQKNDDSSNLSNLDSKSKDISVEKNKFILYNPEKESYQFTQISSFYFYNFNTDLSLNNKSVKLNNSTHNYLEIFKIQSNIPRTFEISSYIFKEVLFFDKKDRLISKQIIAICPIQEYIDEQTDENILKYTFWISFAESQVLMSNYITLTSDSENYSSINDFLVEGKYSGKIIKTEDIKLEEYIELIEKLGH